jgi:hypothetical protein
LARHLDVSWFNWISAFASRSERNRERKVVMRRITEASTLFLMVGFFLSLGCQLWAQAGENAIQSKNDPSNVDPLNSPAFVDASVYNTDICTSINDVLQNIPSSKGVVIDARGITSSAHLSCTTNPFSSSSNKYPASIVLLPAATITISKTWVLPAQTRIIGEGPNLTVLQASGLTGDMIDMGGSATGLCPGNDCNGIVIEHLGLNGGVNGIVNGYAQELSSVRDVSLVSMSGTGISLTVTCPSSCTYTSSNSGPYSDISYTGTGTCVSVVGRSESNGTNSYRGFHGLTCSTTASPAVLLSGPNTTLEDVTIIGQSSTQDGILVGGSSGAAFADALFNIRSSGPLKNLIHITGGSSIVSDITVMAASVGVGNPTNSIQDDLTGTTLTDATVGMYAIGEPVAVTGPNPPAYSRFTTSPNLPSWQSGATQPSGANACAIGSFFSCTGASSTCQSGAFTGALWGCTTQSGSGVWVPLI